MMVGGAMLGYCSTGSVVSDRKPISTMTTEMAHAITRSLINMFPFMTITHYALLMMH